MGGGGLCVQSLITWTAASMKTAAQSNSGGDGGRETKKNKHCLPWRRMRAAVKKAVRNGWWCGGRRRKAKFQYDPWSYALNFDDGRFGDDAADCVRVNAVFRPRSSSSSSNTTVSAAAATLVCVLCLDA